MKDRSWKTPNVQDPQTDSDKTLKNGGIDFFSSVYSEMNQS